MVILTQLRQQEEMEKNEESALLGEAQLPNQIQFKSLFKIEYIEVPCLVKPLPQFGYLFFIFSVIQYIEVPC